MVDHAILFSYVVAAKDADLIAAGMPRSEVCQRVNVAGDANLRLVQLLEFNCAGLRHGGGSR